MKLCVLRRAAFAAFALMAGATTSLAQVQIPASYAAPAGSVDTSKPGFKVRVFKVSGIQVNHVDIAESLIKGIRIDPNTGEPYENLATPGPNPDGSYDQETVINWDSNLGPDSTNAGNFRNDEFFPGVDSGADDFIVEVTGFLDLPAGTHRLGVNSDDGFKLTIGVGRNPIDVLAIRVSGVDTTRGQANTDTSFRIQTAGIYPFRLLYWERGGDARLELSNFTPGTTSGGTRYLVNDRGQANAFKSYRATTVPFTDPSVTLAEPGAGVTGVTPQPFVRLELTDGASAVVTDSIQVTLDGNPMPKVSATKTGSVTSFVAGPAPLLAANSVHTNVLIFKDASGASYTNTWSWTVGDFPQIPAENAVAGVNTSKPGFKVRVYQMNVAAFPGNRGLAANSERALARGYIDPATGQPYENTWDTSVAGPDGFFAEPETINYNEAAGSAAGNFADDRAMPGIPGTGGSTDYYFTEVQGFLELKAGGYQFGVSSDDGFRVSAGRSPGDVSGITLGVQDGTRGTADTLFSFVVPADGFYPIRLVMNEVGGGSTLEFFVVDLATGQKHLINDPASPVPVRAFQEATALPPFVSRALPAQGYLFTFADEDLIIDITDGSVPVNAGSISLKLNGETVNVTPAKSGNVTSIKRTGSLANLLPSGVNDVELTYSYTLGGNTVTATDSWSYTVPPYTNPIPPANKVAASSVSGSGFKLRSHQIDRSGDANQGNGGRYTGQGGSGNAMPRPEIQISNGYINRSTKEPYPNLAQAGGNPDGSHEAETLNHNGGTGANSGVFQGNSDQAVPGLPGSGSSQGGLDNFVQEVETYLELKAGAHIFGVNLDDGFIAISAPNARDTLGTFLGARNPGGGNANPLNVANAYAGVFNVIVPEDGIYPFRILWWQGGGGVNIEFMSIDRVTGVEVLVNDIERQVQPQVGQATSITSAQGIKAYNTYTGPARPWVRFSVYPLSNLWQNQHQQGGPGAIKVVVPNGNPADLANDAPTIQPFGDSVGAVVADIGGGSVGMMIDGQSVTPTITNVQGSSDRLVSYTPNPPFESGSTHTAGLIYAGTTNYWTFTVITNTAVPSTAALPSSAADANAVGYKVKVVQASSSQANTVARAEAQLAGTPASVAVPGPEADGSYIVPGIINWSTRRIEGFSGAEIGGLGDYSGFPDEAIPGLPGTGLSGNTRRENVTAEIFAYLDLPAGYQKFGVNGDDGWKVQIGKPGDTSGTILFTTDRGAGARDIPFAFITPQAGLYPVRLVWYQGGGDGNLEFFTYGPANEKIPVNDRSNPLAVKAYYNATGGPAQASIAISLQSDGKLRITFEGKLQRTDSLSPMNWQDVAGATSPVDITPSGAEGYWRAIP